MNTIQMTMSALSLIAAVGTSTAVSTQPATTSSSGGTITTVAPAGMDYRSCHTMSKADVYNGANEDIANVSDFLIERGSGRIEYAILKTDTTLGMGGRDIAVPYNRFRWDSSNDRFILNATAEQLRMYPEFSSDAWQKVNSSTRPEASVYGARDERRPVDANQPADRAARTDSANINSSNVPLNDWIWNQNDSSYTGDGYGSLDLSQAQTVTGEVKSVSREYSPTQGEQIVAEIKTQDGSTKKVALGPAWFISGYDAPINRGDTISVEVVPVHVATSAKINGRDIALRNKEGVTAWSSPQFQSGGQTYAQPFYRHILLSNVRGANLDCRGTECGRVDDVIVEAQSGTIAFLSIDPNENFLGLGDTKRLVPWTIATVGVNGTVRIDANKEMILASPTTPSEPSTLNTAGQADMVYNAYQISPRTYHPRTDRDETRVWKNKADRNDELNGGGKR